MQNYDQILQRVTELQNLIEASAPCGCKGIEGYNQAMQEAISILNTAPIGVQTQEGEDAILADRTSLVEKVTNRLNEALGVASQQVEENPIDRLMELFTQLGLKSYRLN